ncbi:MAG: DUF72 domain-containing protein [Acidobacteriota bacterium]|nr:DUF72 domain-containing protein [Acidobacteriota bacterium]
MTQNTPKVRIGCAGWSLPKRYAHRFEEAGSHLERYARVFGCVEVNSSFHRPHRRTVWERWAASVPDDFRFAVKAPKAATHVSKLVSCGAILQEFFGQISGLEDKLGPVLVQLPPSLAFDEGVARDFFTVLRELHTGPVVLEPRHASWFTALANRLLIDFEVARVAADPAPKGAREVAAAGEPGGWKSLRYWRLHGSPRVYWSGYDAAFLSNVAARVRKEKKNAEVWVMFDNTAMGEATPNALDLTDMIS